MLKYKCIIILLFLAISSHAQVGGIRGEGIVYYKNPIKEDSAKNAALLLAQRNALINAGVLHSSSTFSQMEEITKLENKSRNRKGTFQDIYKSISYSDVQGLVQTVSIDYDKSETGGYYCIKAKGKFDVEKTKFKVNYNELLHKSQIKIPVSVVLSYNTSGEIRTGIEIPKKTSEELNRWIIDKLNEELSPFEVFVKKNYRKLSYSQKGNIKEITKTDAVFVIYIAFEKPYYKQKENAYYTRIYIKLFKVGYNQEILSTYVDQKYYSNYNRFYEDGDNPFSKSFYDIFSDVVIPSIFDICILGVLSK